MQFQVPYDGPAIAGRYIGHEIPLRLGTHTAEYPATLLADLGDTLLFGLPDSDSASLLFVQAKLVRVHPAHLLGRHAQYPLARPEQERELSPA